MSDDTSVIQRWEAPWFETSEAWDARSSLEEQEALARERGFQAGRQEGLTAAREEGGKIVAALAAVADHMARPFQSLDESVSRELVHLAMSLARTIVRRELSLDSSNVRELVDEALATLYSLEGEIVIFLNPADAGLFAEFTPESLEGKNWKIVEDTELSAGGCQVKTPTSFVDASVEKRLDAVFDELMKSCEQGMES
ncbi:MAG: FliH/SctL family protein [Halioglobus sp.]|nr:FliH/SctL family protein [Halioglobus sp.]